MIEFEVINLDKRTDRWEDIKLEFSDYKLKRFSAIEHKDAWRGCSLSHIAIIEKAKINNKDYVIVLEDDTIILDKNIFDIEFPKIIKYLESNLEKWDIFNMCCTYSNQGNNDVKIENFDLNLISFQYGKTANFIIYNRSSFDKMIGIRSKIMDIKSQVEDNINDVMMCNLGFTLMTRLPFMCIQKRSYSDLVKKEVDYKKVFKENEDYLNSLIKK